MKRDYAYSNLTNPKAPHPLEMVSVHTKHKSKVKLNHCQLVWERLCPAFENTNSVDTNWADRDKYFHSGDFFNVEKFTNATFKSTKFSGDAAGGTLTGTLTFLGVSKHINFPITKIGEGKDPWGGYCVGFEGIYKMSRKDFGMDFNLGPEAELVDVTLQIEAIKDK